MMLKKGYPVKGQCGAVRRYVPFSHPKKINSPITLNPDAH
jgi:hypothetical protein